MFSWRGRRQLIVVLIAVFVVGYVALQNFRKLIPAPTCSDQRKNQGEVETDCGGPCAPCELRNPAPISIFWAKSVAVRPNDYDVAAYVRNPNEVLSSANVEYEFTLFDSLGVVARRAGSTFLFPQEQAHIIEANLETTREPIRVEFRITKVDWKFFQTGRPSLVVERRRYTTEDSGDKKQGVVEATLANRTSYSFRRVEVVILALDSDGNLLGVNRTLVDNLLAGTSQDIRSTWPIAFKKEVATLEIDPRVDIFDPSARLGTP
mgnify:FL=1